MKIIEYDTCILGTENDEEYILEMDNSFYNIDQEVAKEIIKGSNIINEKHIKDNMFIMVSFVCIILFTLYNYFINASFVIVDNLFWVATLLLIVNIPLHELGHIILLKIFYPSSKFKIGFKLVFIYPAFYVDTSYTYLLPKYKKVAVYLAGNVINCLFILTIIFFFPKYINCCYIIISNILVNFIPIVKSDGYYAITALLNKITKVKSKKKQTIEDFIRGLIMFLLLYGLSYVL